MVPRWEICGFPTNRRHTPSQHRPEDGTMLSEEPSGSRKKSIYSSGQSTKRGGGGKGLSTKEKRIFLRLPLASAAG